MKVQSLYSPLRIRTSRNSLASKPAPEAKDVVSVGSFDRVASLTLGAATGAGVGLTCALGRGDLAGLAGACIGMLAGGAAGAALGSLPDLVGLHRTASLTRYPALIAGMMGGAIGGIAVGSEPASMAVAIGMSVAGGAIGAAIGHLVSQD